MSNASIFAVALLAASAAGFGLATTASAQNVQGQDFRAQASCGVDGCDRDRGRQYRGYNDGGLGRYCPPGQYPHSFTGGNGVRCEAVDGY